MLTRTESYHTTYSRFRQHTPDSESPITLQIFCMPFCSVGSSLLCVCMSCGCFAVVSGIVSPLCPKTKDRRRRNCLAWSYLVFFLPCLVLAWLDLAWLALCYLLPCLVLSWLAISCLALSWLVLSCRVLACIVLSCHVLSCLVVSCRVLSCLVLL
jgi:hypothetical protein